MARQPKIIRPEQMKLMLPEDVVAKLRLFLWSEAEGRIPQGAIQAFFLARIEEFFERKALDLSLLVTPTEFGGPISEGEFIVYGSPGSIHALTKALTKDYK